MNKIFLVLLIVIAVAGCTQQKPVTELSIPGHGSQIYTFSNDIREALLVKTNDPDGIKTISRNYDNYIIVYNGSDLQDVGYFRVVAINLGKIPIFYSYEGRLINFDYYYFAGGKWYNSTNEELDELPQFKYPVIWLLGPSTGTNETSLTLVNNTIYLAGKDYRGLTLAGDKLVLLFFGVEKI